MTGPDLLAPDLLTDAEELLALCRAAGVMP